MIVNRELTKAMLKKHGWDNEKMVVIEEMAELTKEISKTERGIGYKSNLVEEMADVYIVLDMLAEYHNISAGELQRTIEGKESRNRRRLGDFHG